MSVNVESPDPSTLAEHATVIADEMLKASDIDVNAEPTAAHTFDLGKQVVQATQEHISNQSDLDATDQTELLQEVAERVGYDDPRRLARLVFESNLAQLRRDARIFCAEVRILPIDSPRHQLSAQKRAARRLAREEARQKLATDTPEA